MNILEVRNLTKRFSDRLALNNVSFDVVKGSICGLLGPNGAGKTTLLRIINSILVSDSGTVAVNGRPVSKQDAGSLGYMPEERGLYDQMRVEDQILYFGSLRGGDIKRMRVVMNQYLSLFNLSDDRRRKVKELSKGNQQKVQIISTIIHEPDLVILDEPFSGFDPINGAILQELIARLHEQGTTVILSSHNMASIEEMCSDIIIINKGYLLVAGRIEDIKEAHKKNEILITTKAPLSLEMIYDSQLVKIIEPAEAKGWRKGYHYKIVKNGNVANIDLINNISIQGDLTHFEESLPSLNDIFIQYTTNQKTD